MEELEYKSPAKYLIELGLDKKYKNTVYRLARKYRLNSLQGFGFANIDNISKDEIISNYAINNNPGRICSKDKEFGYVYIMSITWNSKSTDIVKIGQSHDPKLRASRLTKEWEDTGLVFSVVKQSKAMTMKQSCKLEASIHVVLSSLELNYIPKDKKDGYNEMYKNKHFIYEMI